MRLGIYAFFDEDGRLEEGDLLYLEAVAAELDELVIVVNGTITEATRRMFERYTEEIICRENIGLDAGGFRELLLERLSRPRWQNADELVLFNNTVFGPVQPLRPIFEKFTGASVDFWGITLYHDDDFPDHIQSYFLVFKNPVLQSAAFLSFWENLRMDFTLPAYLIVEYEIAMTGFLEEAGFQSGVVRIMKGNQIYSDPLGALEAGLPVLKKKPFRSYRFRVKPAEYQDALRYIGERNPALAAAVRSYMKRYHVDGTRRPSAPLAGVIWSNEEILKELRPYASIYIYGATTRSFFLMTHCREKQCIFVESDAYYHGAHQGEWPVLKFSELPAAVPDDAIMVVFLRKENVDPVREMLETIFRHVIYVCEPFPKKKEEGK